MNRLIPDARTGASQEANMLRSIMVSLFITGCMLAAGTPAQAALATTAFTYQGQLNLDGVPVTGTADFRFHLYDALTNGAEVAPFISVTNVQVTDGIFTVHLDFGAAAFDGNDRWIEVEARSPAGSGTLQPLAPRQPLTATPYAIQTRGLFVADNGDVGMGTTTPTVNLHVASAGGAPALRVENLTHGTAGVQIADPDQSYEMRLRGTHNLAILDNTASDAIRMVVQAGTGNVGIGTTSPAAPLHVVGSSANMAIVESSNSSVTRLRIRNTATAGRDWDLVSTGSGSGYGGGMFALRDASGLGYSMFIVDSTGHMGIGKGVAPSATNMLKVGGAVECNVVQINGGSDIAEPFEVSGGDVAPGTVVSIDPENPAALRPSSHAYDRTVAGVISGAGGVNPGMMLRQSGTAADGTHPVALTGRVYVRVDADAGGAVQPGDLLTTSDTPGYAMRVDDHARAAGAILGKAMTSLDHGRGLVLVLVSLQ